MLAKMTCFWILSTVISAAVCSQPPGQIKAGGIIVGPAGTFYGRVLDATSKKGLDAASVQLVLNDFKDSIVSGMLTRPNGDFTLDNISVLKEYTIKITAVGYKSWQQKIMFDSRIDGAEKDLGNIQIEINPELLQNVIVASATPQLISGIDRKVFNVDKNLSSIGGTAEDVMRNVPSLSVDIDGNVTLRNSTPQLFIDGRPTNLTLDQIPADAIESVEIITNPSARFDASGGTAGILNIVLKKNRKVGYNGSLRAGIDRRGKYTLSGDINVRQGKLNVFASMFYRQRKNITEGENNRLTLIGVADTKLFQKNKSVREGDFTVSRAGFDYLIDNRNTLTVSGLFTTGSTSNINKSDLFIDSLLYGGTKSSYGNRYSSSDGTYKNHIGTIAFKHMFARAGKWLTADLNLNQLHTDNGTDIISSSSNGAGSTATGLFRQQVYGSGTNVNFVFQTDYANPLSGNALMEFGVRAQLRNVDNTNSISYMNATGNFERVGLLSSAFINDDQVYAAYAVYSNKINDFGYQLGLRGESSFYSGDVRTASVSGKDTTLGYSNNFPVSLFPSIFLTKSLSKDRELQFNISRKINRPNFFQLFPFTDYSDSLNLSRGNPNLKPEFTYSTELSYQKTYRQTNSFLGSIYFKYTDRMLTLYQVNDSNPVNAKPVLISTYANAKSGYITGIELTNRYNPLTWWELTANLNIYTSRVNNIEGPAFAEQAGLVSWFGKLNNTFRLPHNFSFQLSGQYQSKTIIPPGGNSVRGSGGANGRAIGTSDAGGVLISTSSQGFIRAKWSVDMGLRFDFLNQKKGSLTININDIFRSDITDSYSSSPQFVQNTSRLRDPQMLRFQFIYRFGKSDASLFKRKNTRGELILQPD